MEAIANGRPDVLLSRMEGLADPTRLRLLRLLERNELGVAEICEVLQMPQSTVSRHLKVLAEQGWLTSRGQGTVNLYRMVKSELDPAARRLWLLARDETEGWATLRQDELRRERRLRERGREAQEFFAGAAGQWDRIRDQLYGGAFTSAALLALLPREWVVADLGCGTGAAVASLAPHVRRVVGVDQSAAMLKAARHRTEGLGNVELRQGELESLPLPDASCDAALLLLALSYVVEPPLVIAEMARVLRAGGRALIVDLLRHDREDFRRSMGQRFPGFETDAVEAMLAEAGLTEPRSLALAPEPGATGPALFLSSARRAEVSSSPKQGDEK
jgi:ArsR family transcriptional regulator